jgi:hypothetical protein
MGALSHKKCRSIVEYISQAINLGYILSEAKRDKCSVVLQNGQLNYDSETNGSMLNTIAEITSIESLSMKISWHDEEIVPYNYEFAYNVILNYLIVHSDKVINLNIYNNEIYKINRNIIIYLPSEFDRDLFKNYFDSIVPQHAVK